VRTLSATQSQVLTQPRYGVNCEVWVDDGTGTFHNLSSLFGQNFVKSVTWTESMDDRTATFTVVLVREIYFRSLAWQVQASQPNQITGSYSGLVQAGRAIKIYTWVYPLDDNAIANPQDGTQILSLIGNIDTVDPGSTDFEIQVTGRDMGGRVADRVAEQTYLLNQTLSETLEQSMSNDVISNIYTPPGGSIDPTFPPLYVPVSPGWVLSQLGKIDAGQGCLDQLSQMAQQIGWDCRFLWDNGTSAFRLTLWLPNRTATTVVESFAPAQVLSCSQIITDASFVRNVIQVGYAQNPPPAGSVNGGAFQGSPFGSIIASSSVSIAKYGRKYAGIALGASSNIADSAHGVALANAVLADLEEPIALFQPVLLFRPEVMLGDYVQFSAPTPWFDVFQRFAIYAITHTFQFPNEDGKSAEATTQLTCRGYPSTAIYDWMQAIAGPGTAPALKNQKPTLVSVATTSVHNGTNISHTIPNLIPADWHETQVHISTSSGFTPSSATEVARGRQSQFTLANLAAGTTYYGIVIVIDRQGNQQPSAQFSFVAGSVVFGDLSPSSKITFKAHAGAGATLTASTPSTIALTVKDWDLGQGAPNYTSPTFTAPVAGKYQVSGQVVLSGLPSAYTGTGQIQFVASVHGLYNFQPVGCVLDPLSPGSTRLVAAANVFMTLNAGETVTMQLQWNGSSLAAHAITSDSFMAAVLIPS